MRARTLGTAAGLAGAAALHHLGTSWGATPGERERRMPGDDVVRSPWGSTTHAITVDAPPERVWPWIVQMGYHRGGWYTYPWVDRWVWHIDNPSADRVIPELQHLEVGDVVPDGEPGTAYYVVTEVEPPHTLVLHSTSHVPAALRERMWVSWTWSFLLLPDAGRTRLLLRVRASGSHSARLMWHAVVVPSDFVMARSMLRGIRERAEAAPGTWP